MNCYYKMESYSFSMKTDQLTICYMRARVSENSLSADGWADWDETF